MQPYYNPEALCFDDIMLVPQNSGVKSRKSVNLTMDIARDPEQGHWLLDLPVISSPMDTVTDWKMARAMAFNGGLGIIHRYNTLKQRVNEVEKAIGGDGLVVGAAVGSKGNFLMDARFLVDAGARVILVDTANGHGQSAITAVSTLRDYFRREVYIMGGNVSTSKGYGELAMAGADGVRVGIGGGSCCTTRLVSGHGLPTMASLMEIKEHKRRMGSNFKYPAIIADGGIRNTGDMVKAFAAGADAVMLGSMLAGADESAGEIHNDQWKYFRGMASAEAQRDGQGRVSGVEGISTSIRRTGPLSSTLDEIRLGLGSGCSYSGTNNLSGLYTRAEYVKVSHASLGETKPHAIA